MQVSTLSNYYSLLCSNFDESVELQHTATSCHTRYMDDSLYEEACVYSSRSVGGTLSYTRGIGTLGLASLNTDGKTKWLVMNTASGTCHTSIHLA
jgi:hypothetical protein